MLRDGVLRTPPQRQDEKGRSMAVRTRAHPEASRVATLRGTRGARPRKTVPRGLLDPVVDYFKPQRVILFGSRARGEATRDSDIDLLVVVDDDTPPEKLTSQAGYEAHRSPHAADVFPMRAETLRTRPQHRRHLGRRGRRRRHR